MIAVTLGNVKALKAAHISGYLIVEFLLEGWGEVCGHLSNSVAGSIAYPWVLRRENQAKLKQYAIQNLT